MIMSFLKTLVILYCLVFTTHGLARSNEYYHTNKEIVLKLQKEYNEKNKDAISIRRKKYREENKEEIKIKKLIPLSCECGSTFSSCHKARHCRTIKHKLFLEKPIEQ
jgi:hypothetical protein